MSDCVLAFWYRAYSPHRSRWHKYTRDEELKIIRDHASLIFEVSFRELYREGERYWEGSQVEFDCVRYGRKSDRLIVSELKFREISEKER